MDDSEARTVAVVTGGAGGMGLATAKLLGREHHVVVADVRGDRLDAAVEELAGAGVESDAVVCDVTDRAAVRALAAMAASRGTVVSVVHTAGLSPRMAPAEQILRVNALGTVLVDRAFEPYAGHGSCIVNVASTAGHLPPLLPTPSRTYRLALSDPDRFLDRMVARCALVPRRARAGTAYALSKHFVIWWSRQLAGPLGARGARILSVSPGSFDTGMGRLEERSGAGELAARSALGRFGRVEEIAEVLAFVASEKPGYLTGTDVLVDGGAQAVMTLRDTIEMARSA